MSDRLTESKRNYFDDEERKAEFLKLDALIKSGYAGTASNGNIVDRREHPEAIPIAKNTMFGVPEPLPVNAPASPVGER